MVISNELLKRLTGVFLLLAAPLVYGKVVSAAPSRRPLSAALPPLPAAAGLYPLALILELEDMPVYSHSH